MSMEYGLIGKKLAHSFSPELHALYGCEKYELRELSEEKLSGFFAARSFIGINVTAPYKETVLKYLDELSPEAKAIGAVNTVINKGGRLFGYNTDFFGLCALIEHAGISLEHRNVLILGTGGTSKTAAAVCARFGAGSVLKVSRSPQGGKISYAEAEKKADAEIIINTTPSGMFPNNGKIPIDISPLPRLCGVIDAVYNPLQTGLVLKAKERGIPAEGGLYMLAAQAARAEELFSEKSITAAEIDRAYKALMQRKQNIVLIGMPSAGKSTVGRAAAEKLGRSFFDSDELAAALAGKSIAGIFAQGGEAAFRKAETEAAELLAKQSGAVIATGGGTVLSPKNMELLRQNGRIYYINRPFCELSAGGGRPLSQTPEQLLRLFEERKPLYEKYCDSVISSCASAEETAAALLEEFLK